jgi:hypothetical protein
MKLLRAVIITPVVALAFAAACEAQNGVKPSQSASVMQMIADTRINIVYDRPVARGRALFGGIVPWDDVWTPGANRATIFETSTAVVFEGVTVPAGKYSVWAIPRDTAWTVILNRGWDVHHLRYAGASQDVLRVQAKPQTIEHMEVLGIDFPVVGADSAIMRIHWGTTAVPIRLRLPRN